MSRRSSQPPVEPDLHDLPALEVALRRAFRDSGGDLQATTALLRFLVHTSGDWQGALDLEIPATTRCDPEIRALLAVAAGRLGGWERAQRELKGLDGSVIAHPWEILAELHLAHGRLDEAEASVSRLRELRPPPAGLASLEIALARARTEVQKRAESSLEPFLVGGDSEEALQAAEEVLGRWPNSGPARRVLERLQRERDMAEAASLVTRALEAEASGDLDAAESALRRAKTLGMAGLDGPLARVRQAIREAGVEQGLQGVLELMEVDERSGLRAWMALPAPVRGAVARRAADRRVDLLARVLDEPGPPPPGDPVDAVLALADMEAAALRADPEGLLAALAPHRGWLVRLDEARELERRAQAEVRQKARAGARLALQRADSLLGRCEHGAALDLLAGLDADHLLPEEQRHHQRLRVAARTAAELERAEAAVRRHLDMGDLLAAIAVAGENAAKGLDPERWRAEEGRLAAELARRWELEVLEGDAAWGDLRDHRPVLYPRAQVSVSPGGDAVYLADCWGRLLLIRAVTLPEGRVSQVVRLTLPEPMESPHVHLQGDALWLTDRRWGLCLDPRRWLIQRWVRLEMAADQEERVLDAFPVLHGRQLWLLTEAPGGGRRACLLDVASGRVLHHEGGLDAVFPLPGARRGRVALSGEGRVWSCSARGASGGTRFKLSPCRGAAPWLGGDGLVLLRAGARSGADAPGACLALWDGVAPDASVVQLPGVGQARVLHLGLAGDAGVVVVAAPGVNGRLLGVRSSSMGPRICWNVPWPMGTGLLVDDSGRHAVARVHGPEGVRLLPLGLPPPGSISSRAGSASFPSFDPPSGDSRLDRLHGDASQRLMAGDPIGARKLWRSMPQGRRPRQHLDYVEELLGAGDPGRRARREPLVARFLGAIRQADHALGAGDLEAAERALEGAWVWQLRDTQLFARLVAVAARWPAGSPVTDFRRRIIFACWRDLRRSEGPPAPLGDLTWGPERLAELDRLARDRLHAPGPPPGGWIEP